MNPIPQIEPVSRLVNDLKGIFARLDNGPVILANRSTPQAVLVSVAEWDRIALRLKEFERHEQFRLAAKEARASTEPDLSYDEFMTGLTEYHERIG